ncbi:GNAT family N-acetyltransferase [Nocardioides gansuensis]|uniref:GNAT family N-acetyltransferase n=1 Tax=Nocardioides gansuensis TaxID=2138300 RepID=A0A2T8FEL1_9ACTN|nr:GNAT family N-acetyltransferase [Nocardioides gansuensis]PVG84130.1 GNAT family N-acetyltransferase [Nocardioides gansuensis]
MARRTVHLTLDHLEELRAPCRSCLFWELDAVSRARLDGEEPEREKEAWLSEVLREWGSCGRVAMVDGVPVGYVAYAPAAFVPGAGSIPTAPPSPDAVLLTTAWVAPEHRRGGLGRLLVQGMARDLVQRGFGAVEAFGDTRGRAVGCVLPAEFLGRVGFKTQRAHPTTPRMRMELRSAISWKDEVEQALERLWGAVRPSAARPGATHGSVRHAAPR